MSDASPSPAVRRYAFLGMRVEVVSDRDETVQILDGLYHRFHDPDEMTPPCLRASLRTSPNGGGGPTLEVAGRSLPLADDPLTDFHAHVLLLDEVHRRLAGFFMVHAAAVSNGTTTAILVGPSGFGKTTLGLDLGQLGFRLLSDDFAPLARVDGRVHPFPRRVGIRRDRTDRAAGPPVDPGSSSRLLAFGDKWLVDPADLPGGLERTPRTPTHLLLLDPTPDADTPAPTAFRLDLAHGEARVLEELRALDGVSVRLRSDTAWPGVDVEIARGPAGLAACYDVCARHRAEILALDSAPSGRRFCTEPSIEPLATWPAALGVMRHVLNRFPDGALLESAEGSLGRLSVELASLLQGVRCARLQPGSREATAGHVADWLQEDAA